MNVAYQSQKKGIIVYMCFALLIHFFMIKMELPPCSVNKQTEPTYGV